jgi:nitrogen fixation NifU-like protein
LMAGLRDLYQQVILDHNRSPRNFREIADATVAIDGTNPLCGDEIRLYVLLEGDVISDIAFQGSGCAISQASASLMTSAVKGKTREEADELFRAFHHMVTAGPDVEPDTRALGKLAALGGVRQFPARVKCANLAWHTLHGAISGGDEAVSTE